MLIYCNPSFKNMDHQSYGEISHGTATLEQYSNPSVIIIPSYCLVSKSS